MDKMRMETPNLTAANVEKIGALFPNCITETKDENGKIKKAINFDLLRQMLSADVVEGDEAYEFTWVGKKAAIVEANKPIRKTLRPCPEESVDWDSTENLYIEGDNLEVLKLLQESYLERIKMIYIDPPYNTGHDFIYPDSFIMENDEYDEGTGYFDEDGNINYSRENSTIAGKYHSDWCSMFYSRLLRSRNLLSEDGIIFVSIDNNELSNLKKICDEVLGQENLITIFAIENNPKGRKNNAFVAESFEYCLAYAKNKNYIRSNIAAKGLKKFFRGIEVDSDNRQVLHDEFGDFRQSKRQVSGSNKSNALAAESKIERCFVVYYCEKTNSMELLDEYDSTSDEWIISEHGQKLISQRYTRYICTNNQTGRPSSDVIEVSANDVTINTNTVTSSKVTDGGYSADFIGNNSYLTSVPTGSYIISNNVFYIVDSSIIQKGFRGYITVDGNAGSRSTVTFGEEDGPTGIETVTVNGLESNAQQDGKYFIGNRIVIVKNNVKYSANGQILK